MHLISIVVAKIWSMVEHGLAGLESNPFASGGLLLMAVGAIGVHARNAPRVLWRHAKSYFLIEVEIDAKDKAFGWVAKWMAGTPYGQRQAKRLKVQSLDCYSEDGDVIGTEVFFTPFGGTYRFVYGRRLLSITRNQQENNEGRVTREYFTIRAYARSRKPIEDLLHEAHAKAEPVKVKQITIMSARVDDWRTEARIRPRPPESVVLRRGVLENILATISEFYSSQEWYFARGIPHRLGILLHGTPGSGKSSAVAAVAAQLNMSIAMINLGARGLDDDNLRVLLSDLPPRTLLLIEDIDCVFVGRKATGDAMTSTVTFSGLLNALDGVGSGEGRVTFMTTNHPEWLDPALIRPGRVDLRCEVCQPDADQVERLFLRFFPDSDRAAEFVSKVDLKTLSMAALQGHLIRYCRDLAGAIDNAGKIETDLAPKAPGPLPKAKPPRAAATRSRGQRNRATMMPPTGNSEQVLAESFAHVA
jgi:chaperone BCS1